MHADRCVLAYLAGIIDADGYITVQRSVHKGSPYFGAKIGIAGTSREPHDLAASLWGGTVSCYHPKNPSHKPQFQWSRSGRAAALIIEDLRPFLRIKTAQAEIAIDVEAHVEEGRGDDPYPHLSSGYDPTPFLTARFLEVKNLNCRQPRHNSAAEQSPVSARRKPRAYRDEDNTEVIFVALNGSTYTNEAEAPPGSVAMQRIGKARAGRLLDGRTHDAMPPPAAAAQRAKEPV